MNRFYVFDWDDTLQKNLNPRNSFEMFYQTLVRPVVDESVIKNIIESNDKMIVTTRSSLYTFAIRLKCYMITKNKKALSGQKIATINPDFFYCEETKKALSHNFDSIKFEAIIDSKIHLASMIQMMFGNEYHTYVYIDDDRSKQVG